MSIKQVFSTLNAQEKTHTGRFKCCPICGTQQLLKKKGGNHRPACPNCEFVQFRNPVPGVVVVIEKDGYVLLGSITVGGAVTYPTDCNKPQPTIDLVWKVVVYSQYHPSGTGWWLTGNQRDVASDWPSFFGPRLSFGE